MLISKNLENNKPRAIVAPNASNNLRGFSSQKTCSESLPVTLESGPNISIGKAYSRAEPSRQMPMMRPTPPALARNSSFGEFLVSPCPLVLLLLPARRPPTTVPTQLTTVAHWIPLSHG